MAARFAFPLLVIVVVVLVMAIGAQAQLTPNFYRRSCPQALPAIRKIVRHEIKKETRMGASLLRLHFHDCIVNGCDGSILLDDTANFTGEKTAAPNLNSVRGFEVIDKIKSEVDKRCKANVVSCADILAVAARDSVSIVSSTILRLYLSKRRCYSYQVPLGRRDARTASLAAANNSLPPPTFNFSQLISNFQSHGLNLTDLVALSGGHTIGLARCATFRNRIYNETNSIQSNFASSLQRNCPAVTGNGDNNTQALDQTPGGFDVQYFKSLMQSRGLLHSDQELFGKGNSASDALVRMYSSNPGRFAADFAGSMVKMGNMRPLTGSNGEIRKNCRLIN
ncbi:Peroxidase 4 [Linum perenne]